MQDVPFRDQRSVTDRDFFEHLRLPGAAGTALKQSLKADDLDKAVRITARHFRSRRNPRWPFYMHGSAWLEINGRGDVIAKADDLLKNRFRCSWPPFHTEDLSTSRGRPAFGRKRSRLGDTIGRNTFMPELSTAFALTGRTAYLVKGLELARAFVRAFPFILNDVFFHDHDREFGGQFNHTLTVVYRAIRWIDFMHSGAFQVPGIMTDDDVVWFVKQIWFWALQLYRLVGDTLRRDNHHLVDHAHGPFILGVMFPEFSTSKPMVAYARKVFHHHCRENLFPDGGYAEHCTKYTYHISYHYLHPPVVAKANNVPLFNRQQMDRIRKYVRFHTDMCRPDGMITPFGDEYGGSLGYFFGTLAPAAMDPDIKQRAKALGYRTGKAVTATPAELQKQFGPGRPDKPLRVGLSPYYDLEDRTLRPTAVKIPAELACYPHGGFSFFRSAWAPDADYLAISHYTDSMPHGHAHWDPMSFILHTGGRTLIGDPATWIYGIYPHTRDQAVRQEYRGYLYSMDAHNCLVMDEDTLKPLRAMGHECFWGGNPPRHGLGLCETGGPLEVLELWHDTYAPTRHRRYIVHVRGIGFILIDLLSRPELDLRPRQYSQRLHFDDNVRITPAAPGPGQAVRAGRDDAQCLIIPGRETETSWLTWPDQRLKGIFAFNRKGTMPLVGELTRIVQGPAVFSTFLVTDREARKIKGSPLLNYLGPQSGMSRLPQPDGLSAHALDLGQGRTLLSASCPYGHPLASEQMATDGELAIVLLGRNGRPEAWCLANGTFLCIGKTSLYKGRRTSFRKG